MKCEADLLVKDISQLLTMAGPQGPRKGAAASDIGLVENASLACRRGRVVWCGPSPLFEDDCFLSEDALVIDAGGSVVTPGFVDSHTHPLFGGTRQEEFAMRAAGADYEEIAAAGGGILNSVEKTRRVDSSVLMANLLHHMGRMLACGTTAVEVKSGYGLDLETELRCLQVVSDAMPSTPVTMIPTFMGAHEVPSEFKGDSDGYIAFLINTVNPEVKRQGIALFVDIFCEKGVFTPAQAELYLRASALQGFGTRMHADEFHDTGGAAVAARIGASSADHLLSISPVNTRLLAESSTVATLLPGTALFLNKPFPSGRKLIDAGAAVALATDFNPGSCFCDSMPLIVSLGVCQCGLTVEEALVSATANGAAALNLDGVKGGLAPGFDADIVLWNHGDYRSIPYNLGRPRIREVYCGGKRVYSTVHG